MTHLKPAALYIRVSTAEQVEGVSLEAQEAALTAYCSMRGLDIVEIVKDAGVSAGKPLSGRPGGQRLLHLVAEGTVTKRASSGIGTRRSRISPNNSRFSGPWGRNELRSI